jgi:hypothetical protein
MRAMAERLIDAGLFVAARAWVIAATLIAIMAINLISGAGAQPAHPERVVMRIG